MKSPSYFEKTIGYLLNCRPDLAKTLVDSAVRTSNIDDICNACMMLFDQHHCIKQVNLDAIEVWEYAIKIGSEKDLISDEAIHLYDDCLGEE